MVKVKQIHPSSDILVIFAIMFSGIFLFLDSLGGGELLVIMFFIIIFFGSKKIPDLARGLGRGMREFRNAMNDVRSEIEHAAEPEKPQVWMAEPTPEKQDPEDSKSDPEKPVQA
jgi:sec-independent protein translocase protein TatA